jgi:hypothetical protein
MKPISLLMLSYCSFPSCPKIQKSVNAKGARETKQKIHSLIHKKKIKQNPILEKN